MEWISVKDKLPEPNVNVLVCTDIRRYRDKVFCDYHIKHLKERKENPHYTGDDGKTWMNGGRTISKSDLWCYIEPPKE